MHAQRPDGPAGRTPPPAVSSWLDRAESARGFPSARGRTMFAAVNTIEPRVTTGENPSIFITPEIFERIVESERNIIAIDTPREEEILAQFQRFALRSGRAVYAWNERDGIASLREGDVRVPGSMRIIEALRHISASIHFGVYVFRGLPALLQYSNWRGQCMALLRQIARGAGKAGNIRKIVLVEANAHFGDALDDQIERIADDPNPPKKIKLRDGRWVT
jgi:hypothetical protein